jgi:Ca-activated chloride channel family protein
MSNFHILRPEYLLLLLPSWTLVWWLLKQQSDEKKWQKVIDPTLLKHLLVQPKSNKSKISTPWYLGIVLTLLVVAVSGPSWKLKPSPFIQDDTKIALLVSANKSMLSTDILPNRLERASIKITDLLQMRSDTQSALIGYSGTAHLVLPLTKDQSIIKTFAQALDPAIMPLEGDNIQDALLLAKKELNAKGATVIVLTDSVSPSSVKLAIKNGFGEESNVIFWQVASNELSNANDFKSAASLLDGHYVPYARDGSDVSLVSSLIDKNFKNAAQDDKNKYEDGGYALVPLLFLFLLLWARQGFFAELWRRS